MESLETEEVSLGLQALPQEMPGHFEGEEFAEYLTSLHTAERMLTKIGHRDLCSIHNGS